MKARIGIVARPNQSSGGRDIFSIPTKIWEILKEDTYLIGIMPTDDLENTLSLCDGIIFPGGDDPILSDYEILKYADKNNVPVLGICLGMQTMGVYDGGEYVSVPLSTVKHLSDKDDAHLITIDVDSVLYDIIGDTTVKVNSRHKEMITSNLNTLDIVAMSHDGIIEAVERKDKLFWLGVQWHPEDLINDERQKNIFNVFLQKTLEYKRKK